MASPKATRTNLRTHTTHICSCCSCSSSCSSSCFNFANARNVLHSQSFGSVLVFTREGPQGWLSDGTDGTAGLIYEMPRNCRCDYTEWVPKVIVRVYSSFVWVGTRLQVNGIVSRKPLVKFTMRTFNFVAVCVRVFSLCCRIWNGYWRKSPENFYLYKYYKCFSSS